MGFAEDRPIDVTTSTPVSMAMTQSRARISYSYRSGFECEILLIANWYQWRVQDLKEGGAEPIAREARAQKFKPRPQNVDHAPR